jgi:multicomponent Na+:H+ antiporter subunit D
LIVVSSMIAVAYVGRVIEVVWFRPTAAKLKDAKDPPLPMLLPIVLLAAATVYLGFDTRLSAGVADIAASALLGGLR